MENQEVETLAHQMLEHFAAFSDGDHDRPVTEVTLAMIEMLIYQVIRRPDPKTIRQHIIKLLDEAEDCSKVWDNLTRKTEAGMGDQYSLYRR